MPQPRLAAAFAALAVTLAPLAGHAAPSDPAAEQIEAFDASLLGVMRQAKTLTPARRAERFEPVITRTFDLPAMTRFAVGPSWTSLSAADRAALTEAFSRMTVATYAHNFDGYSGERITVDSVDTRGPDKLVHTRIVTPGKAPVSLVYRMRLAEGKWKVIDVYYNGAISSLTGQRSEFAATLSSGGAAALTKKLKAQAETLLKR
ncbi:MAG: ABC transporter substrate-binding protein [Caulobacterales bacterium]|jgi:phospholipid transport system substrate-binding protein